MDTKMTEQTNNGQINLALSPREAAKALSVCEKPYTMTKKYNIPVIRLGRSVRYPLDALKEWIEKQSQENA